MRINLEGEPLSRQVLEIEVDEDITIHQHTNNQIGIEAEEDNYIVIDIHQTKRLIKGLQLAVKEMLEDE